MLRSMEAGSELLGSDSGRVISAAVVASMAFDVPLVVVERPLMLYIANHRVISASGPQLRVVDFTH